MDLKFLDDTNNGNNDNELEKLKKENILLKQQLADARADNFLKLYQDLKKENSLILQELKTLKNNKTNINLNTEAVTKIVQKAIVEGANEGAKKAEDEVQKSISNINGYLIGIIKRFNSLQNGLNSSVNTVNHFFWILCGIILINIGCFAYILYRINILDNAINLTSNNITWYFNGLINALNIWSFFK